MTPVLVFDIETIPDVDGLRRLHDHPDSMTDAEVATLDRCLRKLLSVEAKKTTKHE